LNNVNIPQSFKDVNELLNALTSGVTVKNIIASGGNVSESELIGYLSTSLGVNNDEKSVNNALASLFNSQNITNELLNQINNIISNASNGKISFSGVTINGYDPLVKMMSAKINTDPNIVFSLISYIIANQLTLPTITSKSTFANISHFGSQISRFGESCGCGMWIFLFLIIIIAAVVLHTKGKLKIPTIGQRVAQFGRQIKTIKRFR
jgi:hypothetical protein